MHILYLIFSEGYTSTAGPELRRGDLSHEAIRLTRLLHDLQPHDTEVAELLAHHVVDRCSPPGQTGRRGRVDPARAARSGVLGQAANRTRDRVLSATLPKSSVGPYQLQAAIAAVHDEAARVEDTDWPQILATYSLLVRMSDNPMVRLNHAIAAAMVHARRLAWNCWMRLAADTRLVEHHRLDAVRAHLLELAGDRADAARHYRTAGAKTGNLAERAYLLMQAARLANDGESYA